MNAPSSPLESCQRPGCGRRLFVSHGVPECLVHGEVTALTPVFAWETAPGFDGVEGRERKRGPFHGQDFTLTDFDRALLAGKAELAERDQFECPKCDAWFYTEAARISHVRHIHRDEGEPTSAVAPRSWTCPACRERFIAGAAGGHREVCAQYHLWAVARMVEAGEPVSVERVARRLGIGELSASRALAGDWPKWLKEDA